MNLEELQEMSAKDLKIDDQQLDIESLKTPELYGKYLKIFTRWNLLLKQVESKHRILYRQKWEYYSGKMDEQTLHERGWEPFDHKILRNDIGIYLNGDEDLCKRKEVIVYIKSIVDYLEEVVKEVSFRHMKIKAAIDWRKFLGGA